MNSPVTNANGITPRGGATIAACAVLTMKIMRGFAIGGMAPVEIAHRFRKGK
jgi:hypothetical protein